MITILVKARVEVIEVGTVYGALLARLAGCHDDVIQLDSPTLANLVHTLAQKYGRAFG